MEKGGNRNITLDVRRRVKLEGIELEEYQRREKLKQEQMKQEQMYIYILLFLIQLCLHLRLHYAFVMYFIRETADVSSESEDEIEVGGVRGKHDLLVKQESKPGFFKQSKKQYPMFPFVEEKIKIDEYGEIIK